MKINQIWNVATSYILESINGIFHAIFALNYIGINYFS